jgi:SulP family sulfate permease
MVPSVRCLLRRRAYTALGGGSHGERWGDSWPCGSLAIFPTVVRFSRFFPIVATLATYDRTWIVADLIAGLTLWGLLAPEAMAYAGVAGLPPQAGLYTLVASLMVYGLMGSSRHLSVGATSATAALLASSLLGLGVIADDPSVLMANATALVLMVGLVFVAAAVLRLGFITQFISTPVMAGFVTGLAIFVAVGQLNKLFGVEKPEGNTVEKLLGIVRELPEANLTATAVGVVAMVLLFGLPRIDRRLPAGLIVLFGSIAVSSALDLAGRFGVAIAGELPQGLPAIALPTQPTVRWADLVLPAIGIFFVAYSEALGVAREFAERHKYRVDPDQELRAHGVVNVASSLVGGMVAAGGMSGSAVNEGAGARSSVSLLVAWVAVVATLLFLTPLFTTLPEAVLAALIVHAVWHLIAARKLRPFRSLSPSEWGLGVLTFLGVILIDVLVGMIIGVISAMLLVAYRSSRPHVAKLAAVPGATGVYSDVVRHPENELVPGVLILRLDAPLYFANAQSVQDRIDALLAETVPPTRAVVIDAAGQDMLDVTASMAVAALARDLESRGIALFVADLHEPIRVSLREHGFLDLSDDHDLPTVEAAVEAARRWVSQGSVAAGGRDAPNQGTAVGPTAPGP